MNFLKSALTLSLVPLSLSLSTVKADAYINPYQKITNDTPFAVIKFCLSRVVDNVLDCNIKFPGMLGNGVPSGQTVMFQYDFIETKTNEDGDCYYDYKVMYSNGTEIMTRGVNLCKGNGIHLTMDDPNNVSKPPQPQPHPFYNPQQQPQPYYNPQQQPQPYYNPQQQPQPYYNPHQQPQPYYPPQQQPYYPPQQQTQPQVWVNQPAPYNQYQQQTDQNLIQALPGILNALPGILNQIR